MKKKEFQDVILDNIDIYRGVNIIDATIRYNHPHFAITIYWRNTSQQSTVKTYRGKMDSIKAENELSKYRRWAEEVIVNIK